MTPEAGFGPKLRAFRESKSLGQTELAELAGTSRQTVRNLEEGIHRPSWGLVQKLAAVLGVPTDAFRDPA